jgi:transcriptional antiterminator NusG
VTDEVKEPDVADDLNLDAATEPPADPAGPESPAAAATPAGPATPADDGPILDFSLGDDDEPANLDDIEIHLDFGEDEAEPEAETELNLDFGADEADTEAEAGVKLDDSDDVANAVREKLRQDMVGKEGEWYVVHTYSGMEKRVKSNLDSRVKTLNMEDYIFEAVVPTEDVVEIRNGQKKTVTRTVIPGYVLVRMDLTDDSWAAVRHTPSVTGFVGHANDPVPLSLDEVVEMLLPAAIAAQTAAEGGKPASRRKKVELVDFRVGDSVMLTDGPFTGVHATITEINVHNQRLKATLEFMGRDTPVDLTLDQVQKI